MLIVNAILVLVITGVFFAVILYFVAQKFKVNEDPRIDQIVEKLPGANCGGCGKSGCKALAEAIVKQGNLDGLRCPVGGDPVMAQVAQIMGMEAQKSEPKVAVVRCAGSKQNTKRKVHYEGQRDCLAITMNTTSEGGCPFSCVGGGSCERACQFDAIKINPQTGLPEVNDDKCVACGACVKACPRGVIELRNKGLKNRRVFVSCRNQQKGAIAKKNCAVACIGCGKCLQACQFEAIKVENNLSYIDFEKCRMCRKCVEACPTGAILAVNFPTKKAQSTEELKQPIEANKEGEQK
jgi:electron transport complex, RnfABCDGE type, B subunit